MSKKDERYFMCANELKRNGICIMDCDEKPEGVMLVLKNQYEILAIETWVEEGSYCTKSLFTVENDKDRLTEIILHAAQRLSSNIENLDEADTCLAPIVVDYKLLEQILD